jgi:micrococcal nuclease
MLDLLISALCSVTRVVDGDTLIANCNQTELRIRLCGIDAPEIRQPGGQESKQFMKKLFQDYGSQVSITPVSVDLYGRTIAEVFVNPNGTPLLVQGESLRSGQSYLYTQYLDSCPSYDLMSAESAIAQAARRGVFSDPNAVKPWEFRRNKRLQ